MGIAGNEAGGRIAMKPRLDRQGGVLKAKMRISAVRGRGLALLFAALATSLTTSAGARAIEFHLGDEPISDPLTGAAILGFDPVAYFIHDRAVPGSQTHRIYFAGKVWHFESEANRAAFLADPQVYLPVFGGYDPAAIAAGFAVAGSPELFLILDERIYLFRKPESREAFLRDPAIREAAARNWPQVKRDLVP
jgi:hypothetical protein